MPVLAAQRIGKAMERACRWSCETGGGSEEEERREQMDPVGRGDGFGVGLSTPTWWQRLGAPIFGLDIRDAGQYRHLRRPSKTNFHDQSVTEPSVRTSL